MFRKSIFIGLIFVTACMAGCKKWDDHLAVNNPDLEASLLQVISQHPELTKFNEYLQATGLDDELASSKTYTVWAPRNSALQNIDPAIIADSARLRQFIANHIALQTFFARDAATARRVELLNGKRVTFANNRFDDGTVVEADRAARNGVLHIIDKAAPVLANAWELVNSTRTTLAQNAFILSLTRKVFDPANAIIDSINAQTGQPIYRPGTDSVLRNAFNAEVMDLEDEDRQYTYFILTDTAFNSEVNKMLPFYKTGSADSTRELASRAVVKDLIVEGVYTIDQLPPTLTSQSGVTIPIDKNKIVATHKLSNGIAYVITGINFDARNKLPSFIVQGENYLGFFTSAGVAATPRQNNVSAIFNRIRRNPLNSQQFTDIFVYNHGISGLNAHYSLANVPSGNYKVYWTAVNDTLTVDRTNRVNPATFRQRLAMGSRTSATFPLTDVTPNNFSEVLIGTWTQAAYGPLNMYLTSNGTSPLTLDYIRLVPE